MAAGTAASPPSSSIGAGRRKNDDLAYAVSAVRHHDPAAYLPGLLLPAREMRLAYYAARCFWIETGLRIGSTAMLNHPSYENRKAIADATPMDHLQWWDGGVDAVFEVAAAGTLTAAGDDDGSAQQQQQQQQQQQPQAPILPPEFDHPTLRLILSVIRSQQQRQRQRQQVWSSTSSTTTTAMWASQEFTNIVHARRKDLDVKQYETVEELVKHAELSCGSLLKLVADSNPRVLEAVPGGGDDENGNDSSRQRQQLRPNGYEAARLVGICHGLTNALRTSIPVVSLTGKLIIPAELTTKYGVRSPRYLLSALGQGDAECVAAMERAVEDIAELARDHLRRGRQLRDAVLAEPGGAGTAAALLPGVASETFLNRLQHTSHYQLTDRNLRNVGAVEHVVCAGRMISSYYRKQY